MCNPLHSLSFEFSKHWFFGNRSKGSFNICSKVFELKNAPITFQGSKRTHNKHPHFFFSWLKNDFFDVILDE